MASIISAGTTSGTALNMAGDTSGQLQLATNGSTTAVTIDTSQNVGIGTASPTEKLEVIGSINVTADSSYKIGSGTDRFIKYRTGNSDILYSFDSGDFYRQDITNSTHSWFTGNTERMRINSSGLILFNTTSSITDSAQFQTLVSTGKFARGTKVTTNGDYAEVMYNASGGSVGSIQINSGGTVFATTSDYRLKDNIQPMIGALNTVSQLKPVTYKWKADGSNAQGFIAHELQEIFPDAVTGKKDDINEDGSIKPQGIDTSALVATLTAAIQEQQTIINDLKARITALEGAA